MSTEADAVCCCLTVLLNDCFTSVLKGAGLKRKQLFKHFVAFRGSMNTYSFVCVISIATDIKLKCKMFLKWHSVYV